MSGSAKYKINPLVVLATPTLASHPLSWEWSDAVSQLQFPLGASVSRLRIIGKDVADARNAIVESALEMNADYILFVGDDNIPPPDMFALLYRHKKDLVTGVYFSKSYPPQPYIWDGLLKGHYVDWKYGEFFPVDFAGVDALLASTDVFRALDPPWFTRDWVFEPGQKVQPHFTEDFPLYAKAKAAGFTLWCDTAVQVGHQDRTTGMIFGLIEGMPQLDKAAPHPSADPAILVADIGAGVTSPWFGAHASITRYDLDAGTNPDVRCDIRAIPAPDQTYDIVSTRHTLEHFMWDEAPQLIKEWTRILKVGGELRINVPNLAYAAREILKADGDPTYSAGLYPLWQVYGKQEGNYGEVHRNGFVQHGLRRLLEHCGLTEITVNITGDLGENLDARAIKAVHPIPMALGPILRRVAGEPDADVAPMTDAAFTTRDAVERINDANTLATEALRDSESVTQDQWRVQASAWSGWSGSAQDSGSSMIVPAPPLVGG